MNVKAVLIFRGQLSNQHQQQILIAKMVFNVFFCSGLKICLDVSKYEPLCSRLNEPELLTVMCVRACMYVMVINAVFEPAWVFTH